MISGILHLLNDGQKTRGRDALRGQAQGRHARAGIKDQALFIIVIVVAVETKRGMCRVGGRNLFIDGRGIFFF